MKLHLLGLPHTVTTIEHSHCAFTGKVLRFPAMMKPFGYEIIHYGVEGAQTEATEHVDLMSQEEQNLLRGHDGTDTTQFVGNDANTESPLYREFNKRLRVELMDRVTQNDLVLLPFGHAHWQAVDNLPFTLVESGIGYPTLYDRAEFKIFESYAWMHFHMGKAGRAPKNYEWAIPNYFDVDDWAVSPRQGERDTVVYLGRITEIKGLSTVVEVAKRRPDLQFVICGQGDPTPYLTQPNIKYIPPITGRDRSTLLGAALAVIMPTAFIEPFAGVNVEAQLCGTPVLTTNFGAFTETVEDEKTGFRCHTLGDFMAALERVPSLDRQYISSRARGLYGYEKVGKMYDRAFQQILDLRGEGWYSMKSFFGATTKTQAPSPWQVAQAKEREYHLIPECRPGEQRKRSLYATAMQIDPEKVKGLKILDIGAGPESLLLSYEEVEGTALDPLVFTPEDEARYKVAGIKRLVQPAEQLGDGKYDEAWVYNCLQHVQSPEAVLGKVKEVAKVIRIWEWCGIATDVMHLHVLTPKRIKDAMAGWEVVYEKEGVWRETANGGMWGDYYSAVYQRPSEKMFLPRLALSA